MNTADLKKLALPAVIGGLVALAGAGWVLHEFWSLSIARGGGKYAEQLPPVQVPRPAQ
jgi:hypothetical protein